MKKILATLLCIFAIAVTAQAKDEPRKLTELPSSAQQFLKKHFADKQLSHASQDTDMFDGEYKVVFTNGDKVEFDSKGNWQDVECKNSPSGVPSAIIPSAIKKYLAQSYKDSKVATIEYDSGMNGGYDVKLSSGLELQFNKKGDFLRLDD